MLGKSSRFYKAGYKEIKYKLKLNNEKIVFDYVLESFTKYFETDLFIIICRADSKDEKFLHERLKNIGVKNFKVIVHDGDTKGQAESVEIALNKASTDEELYIFNIDTILFNFTKQKNRNNVEGYIEVFEGEGTHWSFVEPSPVCLNKAHRVVEKERISNLCCNGLYYFRTVDIFYNALNLYRNKVINYDNELYVAPIYNELIKLRKNIEYKIVNSNDIGFCGVPEEYEELKKIIQLKYL